MFALESLDPSTIAVAAVEAASSSHMQSIRLRSRGINHMHS
jgi:hypothetical protein